MENCEVCRFLGLRGLLRLDRRVIPENPVSKFISGEEMSAKSGNLPVFPIVMISVGVILILGSVFWVVNSTPPTVVVSPTADSLRIPYPDIQRISLADAKAAFDTSTAVFLDVRGERDRPDHRCASAFRRFDDMVHRLIQYPMIVGL